MSYSKTINTFQLLEMIDRFQIVIFQKVKSKPVKKSTLEPDNIEFLVPLSVCLLYTHPG